MQGSLSLAYEINKKQYGYYVCIRFEAEVDFIKPLERELKLDDSILRFLTILVPKAAFKEEARTQPVQTEEGEEAKPEGDEKEEGEKGDEAVDDPGSEGAEREASGEEGEKVDEEN